MANNKIQIKRSVANGTVSGLSNGELAFTQASNTLWIGAPDGTSGTIRIGGQMVPGTLTANQALVANSTSGIDKVIVANASVLQTLYANGASGSAGHVLISAGSGANAYWGPPSGISGLINLNSSYAWTNTHTFSGNIAPTIITANGAGNPGTAGQVLVSGGSSANVYWADVGGLSAVNVYATYTWVNNHTFNANVTANTVNAISYNSGAIGTGAGGSVQNSTVIFVGNNTTNTSISAGVVNVNGNFIANQAGVYVVGTINAASHTTGAIGTGTGGISANVTTLLIGNNTVNTTLTSAGITVNGTTLIGNTSGIYHTGTVNAASLTVGTALIGNSTGVYHTGTVNAASHTIGTTFIANTTGTYHTGVVNAAVHSVGTAFIANTTAVTIGSGVALSANGGLGTAGQVLHSNGSSVYWGIDDYTTITAANGLFANASSGAVQIDVGQGNGIAVSADAVAVQGGSTLTVNASGVHVNSTLSIQDLSLSGNLTVSGTLTTIDTTNLTVKDPLIKLANGNSSSDLIDIGVYGVYGNTSNTLYTGLFRDASDGIYKLFSGLSLEPTTTIDTTNTSFGLATLQAYVRSGGLTTNATSANLVANSTFAVGIVANSLTLSTALAGTSGGTGWATVTNQDLLVGNSSNGWNKLSLGTSGYVLQSNGSALVYDVLDGGTF